LSDLNLDPRVKDLQQLIPLKEGFNREAPVDIFFHNPGYQSFKIEGD
jgi:hypothetical protein